MENFAEISNLLIQAPMALIVLVYIYMSDKRHSKMIDKILEILKDVTKK